MAGIRLYEELCKGVEECGICVEMCPKKLFKPSGNLNRKGYRPPRLTDVAACTQCENCMIFCPDLAIAVAEKRGRRKVKR